MKRPLTICCLGLVALLLAPAPHVLGKDKKRDDKQKDEQQEAETSPVARTFTQEELDAAADVIDALTPEQRLVINHLRFLLRPEYENELMWARVFQPCPLRPFEDAAAEPLTYPESVRLWAVLATGLPTTESTRHQVERFLLTDMPYADESLGGYGLQMAVCAQALRRPELGFADKLKERAEDLMKDSMKVRRGTDADSPLIVGETIDPLWFANQLWRAVTCRFAIELEINFNEHVWETAIRNLCGAGFKERGWTSERGTGRRMQEDLDTNLVSIAALSLAVTAPEKTLGRSMVRTVEKAVKYVPDVLARLEKDYRGEPYTGSRLAMIRSYVPEYAPEGMEGEAWQKLMLQLAVAGEDITGAEASMAGNLGMSTTFQSRAGRQVVEAAMACVGLSGGLLGLGEAPLATMSLGDIGRAMYAFSVLHANALPEGRPIPPSAQPEIDAAIEAGCEFLERVQNANGSFPGMHTAHEANTAVAMLAMMHGGWDRDSAPIRKGMDWICDPAGAGRDGATAWGISGRFNYSNSIVMMMFQKYYEPEQEKTGMLWADTPEEYEKARKEMWGLIDKKHKEIIQKLMDGINSAYVGGSDGGWGYGGSGRGGDGSGHWDNSNSQFSMLAMKSASLLGAELSITRIEHEVQRLMRSYAPDSNLQAVNFRMEDGPINNRSASYWSGSIRPGGWGYNDDYKGSYAGMTAAGISSLAIGLDELKLRGKLDKKLEHKIALTIHGAQTWLGKHYFSFDEKGGKIERNDNYPWGSYEMGYDGIGLYYDMYSVERGAVLAGLTQLAGDVDWYGIGGEGLVKTQQADGNWIQGRLPENDDQKAAMDKRPQILNTSWAILFLKKGALPIISEPRLRQPRPGNPITNGPKDKPKDPITEGPKKHKKDEDEGKKEDGPVTKGPKDEPKD